jgi:hypothetical protein
MPRELRRVKDPSIETPLANVKRTHDRRLHVGAGDAEIFAVNPEVVELAFGLYVRVCAIIKKYCDANTIRTAGRIIGTNGARHPC